MDTPIHGPIKLQGPYRTYAFGGRQLLRWKARLPFSGPVAESWEVVDRGSDQSRVLEGGNVGQTLAALLPDLPLGRVALDPLGRFPWLVKLLDVTGRLPLHLHPDDATAARLGLGEPGKHESWVILEAGPGARAYVGLKPGIAPEAWHQALEALYGAGEVEWVQALDHYLEVYPLSPGLAIDVPPGVPHAMLGPVVFYEVQQNSDLSLLAEPVNLYHGRITAEAWKKSLEGFFQALNPEVRPQPIPLPLVTPYYRLARLVFQEPLCRAWSSVTLWTCVEGQMVFQDGGGTLTLNRGETALVPAGTEVTISGLGTALWVGHPEEVP